MHMKDAEAQVIAASKIGSKQIKSPLESHGTHVVYRYYFSTRAKFSATFQSDLHE